MKIKLNQIRSIDRQHKCKLNKKKTWKKKKKRLLEFAFDTLYIN